MTYHTCHIGHCDWLYTNHAITKCKVMYYTHGQDMGTRVMGYFNVNFNVVGRVYAIECLVAYVNAPSKTRASAHSDSLQNGAGNGHFL